VTDSADTWKHASRGKIVGQIVRDQDRWVTVRLAKPFTTGIRRYEAGEEVEVLKIMLTPRPE